MSAVAVNIATWWDLHERYAIEKAAADQFQAEKLDPFLRAEKVMFPEWPKPHTEEFARMRKWQADSGLEAISDQFEEMVNSYCDISREMISRPAPDAKAALWKFDYLYAGDNAGTAWEVDFIKQANADIRRFLENA